MIDELMGMQAADIMLERLNIRLPNEFQYRADSIARGTVKELSMLRFSQSLDVDSIDIPKITVNGGESDHMVARSIAKTIHGQLLHSHQQTVVKQ